MVLLVTTFITATKKHKEKQCMVRICNMKPTRLFYMSRVKHVQESDEQEGLVVGKLIAAGKQPRLDSLWKIHFLLPFLL